MPQEFEWDEAKRVGNIKKHSIDFSDAIDVFDGRPATTTSSDFESELRFVTTAVVAEKHMTVIWTPREDRIRLISARRSRDAEKRQHRAENHERDPRR